MRTSNRLIFFEKKTAAVPDARPRGRRLRALLGGRRGSMSVEFGILVPIFLLLVFGIVDFGHAWYMKMEITSASREAARYGTRYQTNASNQRIIPNALSPSLASWVTTNYSSLLPDDANLQVTPGGPGYTSGTTGDDLSVTVQATKNWFVIGTLVPGIGNSITLSATTNMKVE